MEALRDLYVDQLRDAWSAENQILEALPRMAGKAHSPALRAAFEQHVNKTEGHVNRLRDILGSLGEKPGGKKCRGMEGLLKEGEEALSSNDSADVRDAALIGAAQKVEHYEMALYGTLRAYAKRIGNDDDAALLQRTLDEEQAADRELTRIATDGVNEQAIRR